MGHVQCKASCFEAFCGFPRLAPSVCVFSLWSISVEVASPYRSRHIYIGTLYTAIMYMLLLIYFTGNCENCDVQ